MTKSSRDIPIQYESSTPLGTLGPIIPRSTAVRSESIKRFAISLFDSSKTGITVSLLKKEFHINKEHARRIIKRCCNNDVLFAPENHKPQIYFPVERRPQVNECLYNKKRLPVQPTGTSTKSIHSKYALFNAIENQRAINYLDLLHSLPLSPKYVHNLHMKTSIGKTYYSDIDCNPRHRTQGKSFL